MIYLDSSALVKLLVSETESAALRSWLRSRPERRVSSELARVEVARAVRLAGAGARVTKGTDVLFGGLSMLPISREVIDRAARLEPAALRTLDAIHLAAALLLGPSTIFVAYDARLADAASSAGLEVVAPA
ncbi:MAG: type II toxin-antitoxin system VapC family toxin [Mycobacteriales bacterium]